MVEPLFCKSVGAVVGSQTKHHLTHFFLKVSGPSAPKPVCSFAHFSFDEQLLKAIRKSEFTQPTPIQAQVGNDLKKPQDFIIIYFKGDPSSSFRS
jgi:superfamily II DNA/RNA helicase